MTSLGTIEWFNAAGYPGSTATLFRLDDRYYAESQHRWWTSSGGLAWSELASAPDLVPPEFSSEGSTFEVFEDNGETWATLAPTIGAVRLLQREDGDWVEVPVTVPQPPPGIEFVRADRGAIRVPGGEVFRLNGVPASTVVVRDARFMTVPDPNGNGSGMVALDDVVYGVSVDKQGAAASGFTVWRSEDGTHWAPVDLPDMSPSMLSWAYLTAGHGRLMLSVGAPQEIWTSSDGVEWQRVEGVGDISFPAPPQPTDFGWMITTLGAPWEGSGLYNPKLFRLLVSPDGLTWKNVNRVPGPPGGYIAGPPSPLTYKAGLFIRHWDFNGLTIWVGRFVE